MIGWGSNLVGRTKTYFLTQYNYIPTLPTYPLVISISPLNKSAQLRQLTLSFHQSGRIEANRPRPKPKALTTLTSATSNSLIFGQKRRRAVRGVNERQVIETFKSSHNHQAAGEPNSDDSRLDDSDGDHQPRLKLRRNAYSQEKKLLAIMYCELTDMLRKKEGDPMVPISLRLASSKLLVDQHYLREWKDQKQKILQMKKGAKQW
jgi:hypothetical protein